MYPSGIDSFEKEIYSRIQRIVNTFIFHAPGSCKLLNVHLISREPCDSTGDSRADNTCYFMWLYMKIYIQSHV